MIPNRFSDGQGRNPPSSRTFRCARRGSVENSRIFLASVGPLGALHRTAIGPLGALGPDLWVRLSIDPVASPVEENPVNRHCNLWIL
jgi:hypothetical protein